jgi:hypothetical protein
MTLEQCKRLKEMGFPQEGIQNYYQEISGNSIGKLTATDPTAEEAHYWVYQKIRKKYDLIITNNSIVELNDGETTIEIGMYDTLSDAVYALIEWCYENKLLEA